MVIFFIGGCIVAVLASTGISLGSFFTALVLGSFGRLCTSLAQVMSLDLPEARLRRPFFYAVCASGGGATASPPPRFLLQQLILGHAPADGGGGDDAPNVSQVELTEFSLVFSGILARVDLHSGRATVISSGKQNQQPQPPRDAGGDPVFGRARRLSARAATGEPDERDHRDDAARDDHRVSRVALTAVEALFDPAFVGQWMPTEHDEDDRVAEAVEAAEGLAGRRRLLPEHGDPFAFLRSRPIGWMATVPRLHVSSAEDGPYTAELRKISASSLTVLIVNDANAPIRRHDFQEAMASAQTEHLATAARAAAAHERDMAAAQAAHEEQIAQIHCAYGIIYENIIVDPSLLSLRWNEPSSLARPRPADDDANMDAKTLQSLPETGASTISSLTMLSNPPPSQSPSET